MKLMVNVVADASPSYQDAMARFLRGRNTVVDSLFAAQVRSARGKSSFSSFCHLLGLIDEPRSPLILRNTVLRA